METTSDPRIDRAADRMFTVSEFRSALGNFATGVTIVTCRDAAGRVVGLTANSFNSVSLDPPLVLWCLGRESSLMEAMKRCTHYAVNILAASQRDLAERFARRGIDRFAGIAWREGACGAPVLEGAAVTFECRNRSRYDEGDHTIFVGEVERFERHADVEPLIFHGGRYRLAS